MKTAIRHIVARTYKPLLEKYLSRTRFYKYDGLGLLIAPEVFHPRFFFSTQLLLQQVKKLNLANKTFLEPGCGSGLISMIAARAGARVTATDINSIAIKMLYENAEKNKAEMTILESDLFDNIPKQAFDIIAINPPYYKRQPKTDLEYAWCCGEKGEYFGKLFTQLEEYIHAETEILMVLYEECDMNMITSYAHESGFSLRCIRKSRNLLERNFIYKIVFA